MKKPATLLVSLLAVVLIFLLPLMGILITGGRIIPYLEFPPKPVVMTHPGFSLPVFIFIAAFVAASVLPFIKKGIAFRSGAPRSRARHPFPWWGYTAFLSLVCFWILAWTRFAWFTPFQPHTFFPLWFSWIIGVNALTFRASGSCPLLDSPFRFFCLFVISALFWWMFEYLNRFVGNWIYTGSQYSAGTYFILATLSFSTVLPAVESMKRWLLTFDLFSTGFKQMPRFRLLDNAYFITFLLVVSCLVLLLISIFPHQLFPFVWICPFFIFWGCRTLSTGSHLFSRVAKGDYTLVAVYASAALICGFFWEMFNYFSFARWEYAIPYVQTLHLFEMPVLGYAGYLPFGLECALIIDPVLNLSRKDG